MTADAVLAFRFAAGPDASRLARFQRNDDFAAAIRLADQDISCALFEGLRDTPKHAAPNGAIHRAWRHRAVISRFGRFPRRDAALGRVNTAAEVAYLAQPDAGF